MITAAVKMPPWAREIGKAALRAFAVGLATGTATQITRRTSEAYERKRKARDEKAKAANANTSAPKVVAQYSVPNKSGGAGKAEAA